MIRTAKIVFLAACLMFAPSLARAQAIQAGELVRKYNAATELARSQIEDDYKYKEVAVTGTVKDVMEWDAFDERTDTKGTYYKIVVGPSSERNALPYEVWLFYKEEASVEGYKKGQEAEINGSFIKIIDDGGVFTVWVYVDELRPEDKMMLEL